MHALSATRFVTPYVASDADGNEDRANNKERVLQLPWQRGRQEFIKERKDREAGKCRGVPPSPINKRGEYRNSPARYGEPSAPMHAKSQSVKSIYKSRSFRQNAPETNRQFPSR